MKKIIIVVVSVLIVSLLAIILITHLGNSNTNYDVNKAKNILLINYGAESISDISVYFGEETYYVSKMTKEGEKYISVLNKEYILELMVEENKIKNPQDITSHETVLGYKYDKLVYEVKEKSNDGYNYIYYNALDGKQIMKIKMNR